MKVLLIAKTLTKGGAATGARNLLSSLKSAEMNVVAFDGYAEQQKSKIRYVRAAERLCERFFFGQDQHCLRFGRPVFDLRRMYDLHQPDLIQICDVSGNTIDFNHVKQIPCPVVHRLSDFWPYHGPKHYAESPSKLGTISDRIMRAQVFQKSNTPNLRVAPSEWLKSKLRDEKTLFIRNSVAIKRGLGDRSIQGEKLRLGFISKNITDPRKGFDLLPPFVNALMRSKIRSIELHTFGSKTHKSLQKHFDVSLISHGPFTSANAMAAYQKFDVLLCPSRLDNSPNVVSEALAYRIPVVGQSETGISSYVTDEVGGLINFSATDSTEIERFVSMMERIHDNYQDYSASSYEFAVREMSYNVIGNKYRSAYEIAMRDC